MKIFGEQIFVLTIHYLLSIIFHKTIVSIIYKENGHKFFCLIENCFLINLRNNISTIVKYV